MRKGGVPIQIYTMVSKEKNQVLFIYRLDSDGSVYFLKKTNGKVGWCCVIKEVESTGRSSAL